MSDDNLHEKPAPRSLDGVLDDLRSVLKDVPGNVPVSSDAPPTDTPAVPMSLEDIFGHTAEPEPLAPVEDKPAVPFHVMNPDEPASMPPPIPSVLEASTDECALIERAADPALPPPPVSEAPQRVGWLQPDAGIASESAGEPNAFSPGSTLPEPLPVEEESPFAALIPGTREEKYLEAAPDVPDLELETETRPDGLIQIACLFPEGEEKKGQTFVNRLKESASRMKKPITVQPVFLHTWSSASIDVAAWSTSAALSGADVVFVLAPRGNAPLFGKLAIEAARAGTSGRMVPIEMIQSASLYADVLVDLNRKANGPR